MYPVLLQAQRLESSVCSHCRSGVQVYSARTVNVITEAVLLANYLSGLTQSTQNESILPLDIESTINILSSLLKLARC